MELSVSGSFNFPSFSNISDRSNLFLVPEAIYVVYEHTNRYKNVKKTRKTVEFTYTCALTGLLSSNTASHEAVHFSLTS